MGEPHNEPSPIDHSAIEQLSNVGRAQSATVRRVKERLEELHRWAQIKAGKTWRLYGQTWEEWAEPHLGYSYKTIDNALDTHEKIGEALLRLLMEFNVSNEQVRSLCHAVRKGGLQIEGTVIRDGSVVINAATDVQGTLDYVERLHTMTEAKKQEAKLARQEAKEKDDEIAQVREAGKKLMANQQELIERQKGELDRIRARPVPIHGATAADRQRYPQVQAQFHEIDFACDRLEAMNEEDGHSRGFWRELGHMVSRIKDRLCDLEREVADAHPDAYDPVWPYVPDPATMLPAGEQAERMLQDVVDGDGADA